ncbi:MAG TPA: ParB/RepB/Spo0J family partition protein [Bacteroidales bacterium]|nr:ParB/RepB/Spo0J family partition protein [Bacteroidales bacterium]
MIAKKNALGRGLGALIEEAAEPMAKQEPAAASINEIEIDLIEVNPFQPRKHFDEEALNELAISIKELGIIQPITVRQLDNGKYQLITGERRFRASQRAGLKQIPAYVRKADDQAMLELALVENIQREDLDSIEVAISYQRLIDECSLTQESLSERVGKKRSTVANYLRLLRLPAEIQLGIRNRKLSMGHARALVNVEAPEIQLDIFNQIVEDDLSVRQVEELVRQLNEPQPEIVQVPKNGKPVKETLPAEFDSYKSQLRSIFNSKVELKRDNKGTGKIVIPFNTDSELIQIMSLVEKVRN